MPAAGDVTNITDIIRRVSTTVRTSDNATTTTAEAQSDTVTGALVAGKTYAIVWVTGITSDVAADTAFVRIREDSLTGTILCVNRIDSRLTSGGGSRWPSYNYVEFVAAGTGNKTFSATYVRASGTGNVKITAGTTIPSYLYIELIQ